MDCRSTRVESASMAEAMGMDSREDDSESDSAEAALYSSSVTRLGRGGGGVPLPADCRGRGKFLPSAASRMAATSWAYAGQKPWRRWTSTMTPCAKCFFPRYSRTRNSTSSAVTHLALALELVHSVLMERARRTEEMCPATTEASGQLGTKTAARSRGWNSGRVRTSASRRFQCPIGRLWLVLADGSDNWEGSNCIKDSLGGGAVPLSLVGLHVLVIREFGPSRPIWPNWWTAGRAAMPPRERATSSPWSVVVRFTSSRESGSWPRGVLRLGSLLPPVGD
mmetsp:Transcript_18182/g.43002  ORF Transcript_18182/g.43002 Transcript_18182/m.43002 type:complete len:280 (+) Transcript_18182:403-1242(+)